MFRTTVHLTEKSDPSGCVDRLQSRALSAGLDAAAARSMATQVSHQLEALLPRGRELAELGSSMQVEQEVHGPGYVVRLVLIVGVRESIWRRLTQWTRKG